jgi:hypothetical protein
MRSGLRIVVFGILGQMPLAGIAWQALHYLEGFRRLGCDVHYVEDTGAWPYHPKGNGTSENCEDTIDYIARVMAWCGLADRWTYCSEPGTRRIYGLTSHRLAQVLAQADVLVNLTGSTVLREEHLRIPIRIYLETDPVQAQVKIAQGHQLTLDIIQQHTHHFSFGENLGAPDCGVPIGELKYQPTRQPVVLEWWTPEITRINGGCFSTIANWRQSGRDMTLNGETYRWSKHQEFLKFLHLPEQSPRIFELALACDDPEALQLLRSHGWRVRDAIALSEDILPYRDYILQSEGEFTVAKDQNIRLRTGWFSDRSVCYLAAGRPVITQDTGFGKMLPTGKGLFAYRTMEQILEALEEISIDYGLHRKAAEEIAAEYFSAARVLTSLLQRAGV